MKLYTSKLGPNPMACDAILRYKGLIDEIERVEINMATAENRGEAFLRKNPLGQLPALELENGSVISELSAIAEYLEEYRPSPVLCGQDAEARAMTRMWMRRTDFLLLVPMMLSFRHGPGVKFFAKRIRIEEAVSVPVGNIARDGMAWFNERLADGRTYICGGEFTYVDIVLTIMLGFFVTSQGGLADGYENLTAYLERVQTEPCFVQ